MEYIEKIIWDSGICTIKDYKLPSKKRPISSHIKRSVRSTQKIEELFLLGCMYYEIPNIRLNLLEQINTKGKHVQIDLMIYDAIKDKKKWGKPAKGRSDVDNRAKFFMDAAQRGVKHTKPTLFMNDNQVFKLCVTNLYSEKNRLDFKITIIE